MPRKKMRKPKQTAEEIMLNRWRKLNPTENRDLQILELDWPVAIDILQAAIKIMTDHHHKADQLEDVITQLMSQVLIAYAQASSSIIRTMHIVCSGRSNRFSAFCSTGM